MDNQLLLLQQENSRLKALLNENEEKLINSLRKSERLRESEEKFRKLFEEHSAGMLVIDPDTNNIIDVNPAAARFYGCSVEELKQKSIQQIHLFSPDILMKEIEKTHSLTPNRFVFSHHRFDGSMRDMEVFTNSIEIEGKVLLYSVIHDMTERNQAVQALALSEIRFRSIAEQISEIIFVTDQSGITTYASPAVETITGYKPNEVIGHRFIEFLAEEDMEIAVSLFQEGLKTKKDYILEFRYRKKDGTIFYAELHVQYYENQGFIGLLRDITNRKAAEKKLNDSVMQLEHMMNGTLHAIANIVDAHDPYTAGHELHVGIIASDIAREMGWPEEKCENLKLIGLVHDIGKISIPAEILSKGGRLSPIEYELVKTHAEQGYQILKNIEFPIPIALIIRGHHERMDGSGYPQALKGDEILPESRILAVADVLEAMSAHRPYRSSLGVEAAVSEIETQRGILFDPEVVDAMLRLIREKCYHLPL
ncbi:MAG: PAS domain S-box protein [Chlorobiaceae bacterium]|nr:PAS domain S-box protein [Chlorobiaceae bacterium]